MPPFHLSSTSRALYRVFIAPALPLRPPTALRTTPCLPRPSPTSQSSLRHKHYAKKDTSRHALSDHYTLDTAIRAPYINLIDLEGQFHRSIPLSDALHSFDRAMYHLLLVSPGETDIDGHPDPSKPPTCKLISKTDLRIQHQRKLDITRRQSKGLGTGPSPKNLELNWAIAPGDLAHRLEKMRGFLREGRKVEVMLGPKRRGRVATEKECRDVLAKVRKTALEVKGTSEVKEPSGAIGGVMTLVFEGRRLEKEEKGEKHDKTGKGKKVEDAEKAA